MEKPSFRRITGDKTKSKATEVDNKELEQAIKDKSKPVDTALIAAKEEMAVKFETLEPEKDISDESKEVLRKIGTGEYSVPDRLLTDTQKDSPADLDYNSGLKEIAKKHEALKEELEKRVAKVPSRHHILALRARDRHFNKTCATCGERKLLKNMDGGKAETCDDCK